MLLPASPSLQRPCSAWRDGGQGQEYNWSSKVSVQQVQVESMGRSQLTTLLHSLRGCLLMRSPIESTTIKRSRQLKARLLRSEATAASTPVPLGFASLSRQGQANPSQGSSHSWRRLQNPRWCLQSLHREMQTVSQTAGTARIYNIAATLRTGLCAKCRRFRAMPALLARCLEVDAAVLMYQCARGRWQSELAAAMAPGP